MKPFFKIFDKYKKKKYPPLASDPIVSHSEPEPATSTSIMMASAVPSVPTGSANVDTQVIQAADITVRVRLSSIIITQTSSLIRLSNVESPLQFPIWRSMVLSVRKNMIPP